MFVTFKIISTTYIVLFPLCCETKDYKAIYNEQGKRTRKPNIINKVREQENQI